VDADVEGSTPELFLLDLRDHFGAKKERGRERREGKMKGTEGKGRKITLTPALRRNKFLVKVLTQAHTISYCRRFVLKLIIITKSSLLEDRTLRQSYTVLFLQQVYTHLLVSLRRSEVASTSARSLRRRVAFVGSTPLFLPLAVNKTHVKEIYTVNHKNMTFYFSP